MTEEEFATLLALGREQRPVEFKGPGPKTDKRLFAKVARAVLAMANLRDGGTVVIGVHDNGTDLDPVGLDISDLATWRYDHVADALALYADPFVTFDMQEVPYKGKTFVIMLVEEFEEVPVLCKKDYGDVLRSGACYVRSRRKPESVEIPSYVEMRELVDLATDKGTRAFVRRTRDAGLLVAMVSTAPDDARLYDEQLGDLK